MFYKNFFQNNTLYVMQVSNGNQFTQRITSIPQTPIQWRVPSPGWSNPTWDYDDNYSSNHPAQPCSGWVTPSGSVLMEVHSDNVVNMVNGFMPTPQHLENAVSNVLETLANIPVPVGGNNLRTTGPLVGPRDYVQFIMHIRSGGSTRRRCTPLRHPWSEGDVWASPTASWRLHLNNLVNEENDDYPDEVNWFNWEELNTNVRFDAIRFQVRVARAPRLNGGSWAQLIEGVGGKGSNILEVLKIKNSVITIKNQDNLCLFRSIAMLLLRGARDKNRNITKEIVDRPFMRVPYVVTLSDKAYNYTCEFIAGRDPETVYTSAMNKSCTIQTRLSHFLCDLIGHDRVSRGGLNEVIKLQNELEQRIVVWDFDVGNSRVHKGLKFDNDSLINVLIGEGHYWGVTDTKGFLGFSHYCDDCGVKFSSIYGHRKCPKVCKECGRGPTTVKGGKVCPSVAIKESGGRLPRWINCGECNNKFYTKECFAGHKQVYKQKGVTSSRCESRRSCGIGCSSYSVKWYDNKEVKHECNDVLCTKCNIIVRHDAIHRCYMTPQELRVIKDKYILFDFETHQTEGLHIITHVGAAFWNEELYLEHGVKMWEPTAEGDCSMVATNFYRWLFQGGKFGRGWTAIAHNGQGYDFQFILKYACEHNMEIKGVNRSGGKIKSMTINGLKFICSLSHLTMPLSRFNKTFKLGATMHKGDFPHLFNTPGVRQNYVGEIPGKEYFFTSGMSSKDKIDFDEWHASWKGLWSFRGEMKKYLEMDVKLLRAGLQAYEKGFEFEDEEGSVVKVSPLSYATIASVCAAVFRSCFLKEDTIPILDVEESVFVRRSFSGGRTAVFQANVTGERMEYVDVCSLYPSVNACVRPWQSYPVGEPRWIENPTNLSEIYGFVEVDVTPPKDLHFHPTLATREDGERLNFDLYEKKHAVYATIELEKAIEKGYVVTKMYRALHWDKSSKDLFKGYVDVFMKKKNKASEEKNEGSRACAKLCLNSLWGKFGQRPNQIKSEFVQGYNNVFELIETKEVTDIIACGEKDMMEVVHREKGGKELKNHDTCVAIAAWTTAQARRTLYEALELVGDRAVYCDTDSVIYVKHKDKPDVPQGKGLGAWESELDCGDFIKDFVALGPKMYAYRTEKGKKAVRAKGLRLNHTTEDMICFNNFLRAVKAVKRKTDSVDIRALGDNDDGVKYIGNSTTTQLVRAKDRSIVTKKISKKMRSTLATRGKLDLDTLRVIPFGPKI